VRGSVIAGFTPGRFLIASVGGSLAEVAKFGRAGLPVEDNRSGSPGGAVNVRSITLERQLRGESSDPLRVEAV